MKRYFLILITVLCPSLVMGEVKPQEAKPGTPKPAEKLSFTVTRDLGITYGQAWNITDATWAQPPVLEKIQKAIEAYPESELTKVYLGRYFMLQGDLAKAEAILKPLKEERAHFYLLQGCLERKDDKAFLALYDARPACGFTEARDRRLALAMEAKDTKRAGEILAECFKGNAETHVVELLKLGADHGQHAWTYAELGKIALRIPADEKGSKLLTRVFAERDKLKILFPDQIQ